MFLPGPLGLILGIEFGRAGHADYHAKAVHFDGASYLLNASVVSPDDSRYGAISFWFKLHTGEFTEGEFPYGGFYIAEPGDIIGADAFFDAGFPGAVTLGMWAGETPTDYVFIDPSLTSTLDAWHHYLVAIDLVTRELIIYLDDVLQNVTLEVRGDPSVFKLDGSAFTVADDGYGSHIKGDIADFWIAPGANLASGGAIPEITRRKFISSSGKPVFLGDNGEIPTGSAPVIFMSGNGADFGTNRGSGGAFSVTGVLTDAITSPSD